MLIGHRATLLAGFSVMTLIWAVQGAKAQEPAKPADTSPSVPASPAPTGSTSPGTADGIQEIVVTAQKRSENINSVGMSITAATGAQLSQRGITDLTSLAKVAPGFTYNQTSYGTPVYTIRGIGFQESSIAASPSVSVYLDEVPLPFPVETQGIALDLERVEVLKGPQGTLYGENSTGGALNFIAAKPTRDFQAGFDGSYGRFNTVDAQGYVSGPLADTLQARLAVRVNEGDDWQRSYTRSDGLGKRNFIQGRLVLDWEPTDRLKVEANVNGWVDRSDSVAPQLVSIVPYGSAPIAPGLANYPPAPHDNRAADWDPGVSFRVNNRFFQASLRADYDLGTVTLTSLSAYQHYSRYDPTESDGTSYQDDYSLDMGNITTYYQELRLSGDLGSKAKWIIGANYQHDKVFEDGIFLLNDSSDSEVFGLPLDGGRMSNTQTVSTKAVFGNLNYNLTDSVVFVGGVRYTASDRHFVGCDRDTGSGEFGDVIELVQAGLKGAGNVIPVGPGACATLNSVTFDPGLIHSKLSENNVSWRAGLNWKIRRDILLYGNISKGYKAGSFPNLGGTVSSQYDPVKQESVLAYEAGVKATLFDRRLQLDAAGFYYNYTNKQIRGRSPDPIFGPLEQLVNIPKSQVYGAEVSASWIPVRGLTIAPSLTYVHSKIGQGFSNYTAFGVYQNFSGEPFPYTPKWQGSTDAEYKWSIGHDRELFVGGTVSYRSHTNAAFGEDPLLNIKGYSTLDLRAGIGAADGAWRFQLWGTNVTNTYYWTSAGHLTDTTFRYTGEPLSYGVRLYFRFK